MNNLRSTYCYYCERPYGAQQSGGEILLKTKDHIIPISKGGRLRFKKNILYCCDKCNQLKGDMTPEEFYNWCKKKYDGSKMKHWRERLITICKNTIRLMYHIEPYKHTLTTVRTKKLKNIPPDKIIPTLSEQWQQEFEAKHRPSTPLWWRGLNEK